MMHLSLWHIDNSERNILSFALIPRLKARASLRELRRDVARLKPAPLVLHTTPSLEVSHAALLYDRLCNALPTAFPDTALPLAHFEANLEAPPPANDYYIIVATRDANDALWHLYACTGGTNLGGTTHSRVYSEREKRALKRDIRQVAREIEYAVATLWTADIVFSEILRRRCGLGKRESRGWLIDVTKHFE